MLKATSQQQCMSWFISNKTSAVYSALYCAIWILICGCTHKYLPRALYNYECPWEHKLFVPTNPHKSMICTFIYWSTYAFDVWQQYLAVSLLFLKTSNLYLCVFQALKLSDELNLNEIECVRLLVDANREVTFAGFKCSALLLSTKFELLLDLLTCIHVVIFQWVLYGREPLEIYRLAAGLWYMERRDLITALYILLRVIY
jgi:hypothetical protein